MSGILKSIKETFLSIGLVVVIILGMQAIFAPLPPDLMVRFLIGTLLLILGLGIFNFGVTIGMEPMGAEIGAGMAKSRSLWVIVVTGFIVGFTVTLAEPDLQVLTSQVDTVSEGHIAPSVLLFAVAAGVGLMVVVSLLRILFQWRLRHILWLMYALIFVLAAFAPQEYVPIAFDSGGVTTGPMTVPFILSMGIGVSYLRSDKGAEQDSFGLVGLVSTGPVLAVLILGVVAG